MFSLIVADDEFNIREGISDFIRENHPDIVVSGCFEDGCDVIEYLKNNRTDIVITDIRMLSVTGIEVAKYVYENCPDTRVIILSGFREFEYARSAMNYNVKHYLIKPTDLEELSAVLKETVSELARENEEREQLNSYEKYASMLKEEFLSDLLIGAIKDEAVLRSRFELLGTSMKPEECGFGIINLYIEGYSSYLSENWSYGKDRFNIATKNFIETQNTENLYFLHVMNDKECMKLICICRKDSPENMEKKIRAHIDGVQMFSDENLKISLKFEIEKLYSSVEELLGESREKSDDRYVEDRIKLLLSHINLKNEREIINLVENYSAGFEKTDIESAKKECCEVVKTVSEYLSENEAFEIFRNGLDKIKNVGELADYMKRIFLQISGMVGNPEREGAIIRKAKEFVDENFSSDISLEDVAEHVFLNAAYFSRYFKQYSGENFTTYLLKKRMEYAKQLLDKRYSTESVARACGYSSSRYFAQSFKKFTGVTPKEYRMKA